MEYNKLVPEYLEVQNEIEAKGNLAEVYARYSNRLANKNSKEEEQLILGMTSLLKSMIIVDYMKQQGYVRDWGDDWSRWEQKNDIYK